MIYLSPQTVFYIVGANAFVSITLLCWIFFLHFKLKKMLAHGATDLAEHLIETKDHIGGLKKFEKNITEYLRDVEKRVARSVQAIETVRFTPFGGGSSGGNQSFSTAFVNESGDGIVVSGLYYSRDRVSIFTKPIKAFLSEHELTPEEIEAISRSKNALKK